jgi:hypothetical protein
MKIIDSPDGIPEFTPQTWIDLLDDARVEKAILMGMDAVSDGPHFTTWTCPWSA